MYFIYLKSTGAISPPVRTGEPDQATLDSKADCGIGGGVKWDTNELFYAPDDEFPEDFRATAAEGKYIVKAGEIIEVKGWEPQEEPEEWR